MKLHNRIQQLGAFLLILLFSVQAGVGLWLHTRLHQHSFLVTKSNGLIKTGPDLHERSVIDYSCSCLDFLSNSFYRQGVVTIPARLTTYFAVQVQFSADPVIHALYTFRPLRAPPALLS